jgi:hypothetical protein
MFSLGLILNGSQILIGYFPCLPLQDFIENTFLFLPLDLLLVVGFYSYFLANFHPCGD